MSNTMPAINPPVSLDETPEESAMSQKGVVGDVTGITGSTPASDWVRLITQFGLLSVFAAAILTACGMLLWFVLNTVRADALAEFQRNREDNQKAMAVQREDHKEDRREMRDSIKALWANSRSLTDAMEKANENAAKVIEIGNRQLQLMEKIANKMP
jgi:hypothetical protein